MGMHPKIDEPSLNVGREGRASKVVMLRCLGFLAPDGLGNQNPEPNIHINLQLLGLALDHALPQPQEPNIRVPPDPPLTQPTQRTKKIAKALWWSRPSTLTTTACQ